MVKPKKKKSKVISDDLELRDRIVYDARDLKSYLDSLKLLLENLHFKDRKAAKLNMQDFLQILSHIGERAQDLSDSI